jgi:ferredoxin-type protein NapH
MRPSRYVRWRRACQGSVALAFLAIPLLNARGHGAVSGTAVALKIGPLDLLEPASALSAALASGLAGAWLLGALPIVLFGLALGPALCAWACPWGLVSEGLDALRQRLRPRPWSARSAARVRGPRALALLGLFAAGALVGLPLCALVAGPRITTAAMAELVRLRSLSQLSAVLLAGLTALELLGPRRLFCRALCPAGALATYLKARRGLRVQIAPSRCRCPVVAPCHQSCPWGIDPRAYSRFDGCTLCAACFDACPRSALAWTAARPTGRRVEGDGSVS